MSHTNRIRRFAVVAVGAALAVVLPLLSADDDAPAGRQYALLVGVKNYNRDELRNLDYTENDVNDLAAVLKDAGYKRVVLLTQAEAADKRDNSLLPTGENIRLQLQSLLDDRKAGDMVLVAFSGHGVQPHGEKGSYFCPMDAKLADRATLIPLADVYGALDKCQAGAKVMLVDACRNDPLAKGGMGPEKLKLESVTRPATEKAPEGVAALFSCSEGQEAYDSGKLKHGIFFHFIIQGLKGQAANKKNEVTVDRLAAYVKEEVPDAAKEEQGPKAYQLPESVGDLSGAVPLVTGLLKGEITSTTGMKLKLIRPGTFLMGSPNDEKGHKDNERRHQVEITRPFYMGVYPVTKGQFAAFVRDAGYQTDAEKTDDPYTWRKPGVLTLKFFQTDNEPVVMVTWNDAVKFCEWLSKKEGRTYELPTEAEWECACRAGTDTAFFIGNDPAALGDYAWYGGDTNLQTHPVGKKKPNPWGLYDMTGNVQQWCADWLTPYGDYEAAPTDPKGPSAGQARILRGVLWTDEPGNYRSAARRAAGPELKSPDTGFRVVMRPGRGSP